MKRLPEKTMMAVIILSCGFVMHAEPAAQKAKRIVGVEGRSWQMAYAVEAPVPAVKAARTGARQLEKGSR